MRNTKLFNTILLSTFVVAYIAMSILCFILGANKASIDIIVCGLVLLFVGFTKLFSFISLKEYLFKLNIGKAIFALIGIIVAVLFICKTFTFAQVCIIWGSYEIASEIYDGTKAGLHLFKSPLTQSLEILVSIAEIVFGIILIIKKENGLIGHFNFMGVAFLIYAFINFIEIISIRKK